MVSQPMLGMGKGERPNIPPRRMGGPDGSGMGPQVEMEMPMTIVIAQMKMEDPVGMETLQIEEEDLLERMEIQMEEMVLTLMIVGMDMYCKGLQGHKARKGNLDNLDRQEEMAEMDKPCH